MKQIFQSLKTGETLLIEVPVPDIKANQVLIKTEFSLVSAGTERMLVEFGKSNYIEKVKQQPDKVKDVINKAKTDGIISTFESVNHKLNEPLPLGYCNVGKIIKIGSSVTKFKIGDRVVSNGPHAEIVAVPEMLCASVPPNVSSQDASFTVLGSIGLQGIRLANPTLGEVFVVSGLGLIGLITAQLLIAQGCIVFGLDPDKKRCEIANSFGIRTLNLNGEKDPVTWCLKENNGQDIDGIIITASTTSNEPLEIAAKICRKRGRIILVGVTGMQLRRDLFYKKEISFQVSCSYGPGRYDSNYEDDCQDYPIGFVRWTEQRNFEAILQTLSLGNLKVNKLITHKFSLNRTSEAYKTLIEISDSLGILIEYPTEIDYKRSINLIEKTTISRTEINPIVSFIGAGNYASKVLIPEFYKANCHLDSLGASRGEKLGYLGRNYKFNQISTDSDGIIKSDSCNTIVIATRHDTHGFFVEKVLKNNKNVFVEKPLCLTNKELGEIKNSFTGGNILMVGYNRRFAPLILEFKKLLNNINGPKSLIYTCNAGYIDSKHWSQDPIKGGGRLLGEACHFVDLLRFLVDFPINNLQVNYLYDKNKPSDSFSISISFEDGSIGTIHYYSNGSKSFQKERIEVFGDSKVIQLNNFLKLRSWGYKRNINISKLKQDKGQRNCISAFLNSINKNQESPIPIEQIFEVQEFLLKASK